MKVLLVSMPDTSDIIDFVVRLPNLAVVNLSGNLTGHEVKVLDLVVFKPRISKALEEVLNSFQPDLVGLSAMTFQFDTLLRIAQFIQSRYPSVKLAAGGYHVTLLARELAESRDDLSLDFMIRGEGELTFPELVSELEKSEPRLEDIPGLSYRQGGVWVHNEDRFLADLSKLPLPNRTARIAKMFNLLNLPMDVAETSRGCPYNCKFCSINNMYGRTFRPFPLERIIADLKVIRKQGTRAVFFVDDNITYDAEHLRRVCQAILQNKLNDMTYLVQVTAAGIANNPDLVLDMDKANFRFVFVGFEAMIPSALKEVKKPTNPDTNRRAAALLREHHMAVIAGCIVGYPDDTKESVRHNYRLIRQLKPDMIFAQYLTPYPKTIIRKELLEEGLVENMDDYSSYDGFSCNTRTHHLSRDELYRCLKKEALLGYTDMNLVFNNYFLKKHTGYFINAVLKAVVVNIYNVFALRQRANRFDI